MKFCKLCEQEKDLREFKKDNSRSDGYQTHCKSCQDIFYRLKLKISLMTSDEKLNYFLELYHGSCYLTTRQFSSLFSCEMEHIHQVLIENDIKKCSTCYQVKKLSIDFNKSSAKYQSDGYQHQCKVCAKNSTDLERKKIYNKKWFEDNKEHYKELIKKWQQNNKERIRECQRALAPKKAAYIKKRRDEDPIFRFRHNLGGAVWSSLKKYSKGKVSKGRVSWEILVRYTLKDLVVHIESKFKEGMTWENYGKSGWELDHIKPVSSFDLSDSQQFLECWSLNNLQPLWREDNLLKGNNIGEQWGNA